MKKPPKKSRKSRLHTAEEKAKHRNPQMPRLRKGSVHPVATNPQNPLPEPRKRTKRKRKPYKLHEATIKRLIASIDAHSDAPMYVHLRAAGIHPDTFNEWKGLAAENPDGMHAFFLERVDKALARAWGRLHEAAVKHRPTEVLFRRHHQDYPSERQHLELSAPGGLPLIPSDTFNVVIELASPQPLDREFVVEHKGGPLDGKREIWQPNGHEPPS